MRVLIAGVDGAVAELLSDAVDRSGFDVVAATSITEGVATLEKAGGPRIALLAMSGLREAEAACDQIRAATEAARVHLVLIVGRDERRWSTALLASGRADDVLTKPIDADDVEARLVVARRALALRERLVHARARLDTQAMKDALTGAWGREATLGFLARELVRSRRESETLSVVLVTLDGLRAINRSLGLERGDEALRRVAETVSTAVRSTDWVGRFSGRRFLLILPRCVEERARAVGARVSHAVTARLGDPETTVQLAVECVCLELPSDQEAGVPSVLEALGVGDP